MRDRRVVDDPTVHEEPRRPLNAREHPWDRRARKDGIDRRALREEHLLAAQEIRGNNVQIDGCLLEPGETE